MPTLDELQQQTADTQLNAALNHSVIAGLAQYVEENLQSQKIYFGQIIETKGGMARIQTKDEFSFLPISRENLVVAPRGIYTLANGEQITNPDYLLSWRLDLVHPIQNSEWTANTAPHGSSIVGKEWDFEYQPDTNFIKQLIASSASEYIGQTLLAGLREYEVADGVSRKIKQTQVYGIIERVTFEQGIVLKELNGSEHILPPDLSFVQLAPPGEYQLHNLDIVVTDPRFIGQWKIFHQKNH